MGADVIASRIVGKEAMIQGRLSIDSNGRNWWLTDPVLVSKVEQATPFWYKSPSTTQVIISGTESSNVVTNQVSGDS